MYNLGRDPEKPIATVDGTFVWAIEDELGIYYANTSSPRPVDTAPNSRPPRAAARR